MNRTRAALPYSRSVRKILSCRSSSFFSGEEQERTSMSFLGMGKSIDPMLDSSTGGVQRAGQPHRPR